jgi:hypothetical protein
MSDTTDNLIGLMALGIGLKMVSNMMDDDKKPKKKKSKWDVI